MSYCVTRCRCRWSSVNSKHKIGLGRPEKHKLGLRGVLGNATPAQHQVERVLRDQFWLPTPPGSSSRIHNFSASRAESASCAAPSKKND